MGNPLRLEHKSTQLQDLTFVSLEYSSPTKPVSSGLAKQMQDWRPGPGEKQLTPLQMETAEIREARGSLLLSSRGKNLGTCVKVLAVTNVSFYHTVNNAQEESTFFSLQGRGCGEKQVLKFFVSFREGMKVDISSFNLWFLLQECLDSIFCVALSIFIK